LLEGIVADPDQSIATLPILTEAERHQILVEWNDTAADFPKDKGIHQLFEEQVERIPEAIAVEFEDRQITYQELNRRANQLAHHLIGLGIGPEKLVGICVERSIEMVVGLLGILKAGGAYIPLDPSYPEERLRFMIKDAQVSVLLTEGRLLDDRGWIMEARGPQELNEDGKLRMEDGDPQSSTINPRLSVVCFDRDALNIEEQSSENPTAFMNPTNLAYVIYTSGSTGRPKGVLIPHCAVVNHLHWAQSVFRLDQYDRVLHKTSLSFDASVWEIFGPLIGGACLVLARPSGERDGNYLVRILTDKKITAIKLVPSLLQILLEGRIESYPTVRHVLCGGERLTVDMQMRFYDRASATLHNLYGPTEATVDATYWTCLTEAPQFSVSIGRPIANTQVYVLDAALQPVPIGVSGELHIGGACLALGYLNRPALTSEKFIPNPFLGAPNARLYKTGDVVRYLKTGILEFVGRADAQIKIRGYRIEPGEIECVLNQHPVVKESLVIAKTTAYDSDSPNSKIDNQQSLVAYLVTRAEKRLSAELRAFLTKMLPDWMVPTFFVFLDALPLTHNGKIDRLKLPSPANSPRDLSTLSIPPRTEIEELIADIWRDVLKIGTLSVYDNFFALGGHSLLAINVASRLQDAFNHEVPVRLLFDSPTVGDLAFWMENVLRDDSAPTLPPIVPVPPKGPLPLSMNQEHIWRLAQNLRRAHFFHMPYVFRLSGDLNANALELSIIEIIKRHEILRTVFRQIDGCLVQVIKEDNQFRLHTVDFRNADVDEVSERTASVILEARTEPFDLSSGPLVKAKLLCLTDKDYLLLVTMHHIVSDEWSMGIFWRELTALYKAYSEGRSSPLASPPIQYADFASWERQQLNSGNFNIQLRYWTTLFNESRAEFERKKLPKRRNRLSFRTKSLPVVVGKRLALAIKTAAKKEHTTTFVILVAAWSFLLHRWTGQRIIRIGTFIANRARKETGQAIGHFVNTIVLHIQIDPKLTFRQLIRRVGNTFHAALANQEIPFEAFARVMEREHNTHRSDLFRVMFTYSKRSPSDLNLAGIKVAPLGWQPSVGNSDLTLTACDILINMQELTKEFAGTVKFKPHTFRNDVVSKMITQLTQVLRRLVADSERQLV
jgi:amino acid adenylation domain-containing protein